MLPDEVHNFTGAFSAMISARNFVLLGGIQARDH